MSKDTVKQLSELKSSIGGTNLVTLHIPSNYAMSLVSETLTSELSTAENIKDKNVRKSVTTALKSSIQTIKSCRMHHAPINGLVLCASTEMLTSIPIIDTAAKYYL